MVSEKAKRKKKTSISDIAIMPHTKFIKFYKCTRSFLNRLTRLVFPQEMNDSIECNEYKYLLKGYILGWLEIKNNNKKTSMENNKLTSN